MFDTSLLEMKESSKKKHHSALAEILSIKMTTIKVISPPISMKLSSFNTVLRKMKESGRKKTTFCSVSRDIER